MRTSRPDSRAIGRRLRKWRRASWLPATLLAAALLGCGSDPTGPGPVPDGRLATLTEYPFGGAQLRQRGTYRYDRGGRLIRFELVRIEELESGPVETMTYYSNHFYTGDRRVGGEVWIRMGDSFVQSREWSYGYDAAGRVERFTLTTLLAPDFSPIRESGTESYLYDDRGRIREVLRAGGDRWQLYYDGDGNLHREELYTTEGAVISFEHTYDDGVNPFYGLWGQGLVVVVAPWALLLSPRNVIRTETTVAGVEGVVSRREVHINSYTRRGAPRQWIQRLINTSNPDDPTVFVAELAYGGDEE